MQGVGISTRSTGNASFREPANEIRPIPGVAANSVGLTGSAKPRSFAGSHSRSTPTRATEPAKQQSTTRAITPQQAARNWLALRDKNPHTLTAEEGAKKWLEQRKSHGTGPTAKESAQNWLAQREAERQKEMDHSHGEAAGFTRGPGAGESSVAHDDEDEEKRKKGHSRDNEHVLE
jgi:hypothetical protein